MTKKSTTPKTEVIKNTQIALETLYDKQVSIQTIRDVVNAYEEVLKTRLLKNERLLTNLGILYLHKMKPKAAGTIGQISYNAVPERYKPKIQFNNNFKKEISNLEVTE